MTGIKKLTLHLTFAGALMTGAAGTAFAQWGTGNQQQSQAQPSGTPPPASRGENFSAKPAPQLFASDCTGAGCHKGPQGLAKDRGQSSLASFLREHYTNSRESAASLAAYLTGVPGAAAARPDARPPRAAARSEDAAKPPDDAARARRQPAAGDTGDQAKPAAAGKPPRGRQATAPAALPPPPAPAVAPPPEPPAPPPEPPKPQWDIFD